jgi:cytochrome P450
MTDQCQLDRFGLLDPGIFVDPYSTYHLLRYEEPIHWSGMLNAWVLTRYADVSQLLTDPRLSSARRRQAATAKLPEALQAALAPINGFLGHWLLHLDPPLHTALRSVFNEHFTKARVGRMAGRIGEIASELAEAMKPAGAANLISAFAHPLPVSVIAELMGIPRDDWPQLHEWFAELSLYFEIGPARPALLANTAATIAAIREYLARLLERKRRHPGEDVISALPRSVDGGGMTEEQCLSNILLFLFAGHESTRSTIGNGVLALLTHPESLATLRRTPALLPSAVEEILRFDGPFMRQDRAATEDIAIGGRTIRAGQHVILVLGAANRDGAQFPNPDTFDITRRANAHLAFAQGAHYCIGAHLARLEIRIALETLLREFPRLRLSGKPIRWREHFNHRGMSVLPVAF